MRTLGLVVCLIVSLGLAACATPTTMSPQGSTAEIEKETRKQRELALKRGLQEETRIQNVAYPILKYNRALCTDTRLNAGVFFWNEYALDKEYKNIANVHYGLGEVVQVRGVLKSSPADKAGITVGDKLIAMVGNSVYGDFWPFSSLRVIKNSGFGKDESRLIECSFANYPDCDIFEIYDKNVENERIIGSFVALCRKEFENGYTFDKCEVARILAGTELKIAGE